MYGSAGELTLGAYNVSYTKNASLFWVAAGQGSWTVQAQGFTFDHTDSGVVSVSVQILTEYTGIGLSSEIYAAVFSPFMQSHAECNAATLSCSWTADQLDSLPRFVVKFDSGRHVVLHPSGYAAQLSPSKWVLNVKKVDGTATVILGGDVLDRVYVVLSSKNRTVGFVKYVMRIKIILG